MFADTAQVIPFELVITREVPSVETATKTPSDGDHAIDVHEFAANAVCGFQVLPSVLVITRYVPELATATNNLSEEDHTIDCH